jgi:hypothetical protein
MSKRRFRLGVGLFTVAVTFVTISCGGGGDGAKLRVVNASPNESGLTVLVDTKTVATSVAYGSDTGYLSIDTGSRDVQIEGTGSANVLIDQTITANSKSQTTLLATNVASNISGVVLTDNNTAPASGNINLRIVNAAPSLGSVDVYVVAPGADLVASTPVVRSLAFDAATSYQTLTAGAYEVVLTVPGSTFALVDTGSVTYSAGQNRTIVTLNGVDGGFTTDTLADLN